MTSDSNERLDQLLDKLERFCRILELTPRSPAPTLYQRGLYFATDAAITRLRELIQEASEEQERNPAR